MAGNGVLDIFLLVGFTSGVTWLFRGYRQHRKYLALKRTPPAPAAAITSGLVRVRGKAQIDRTLASPLSGTPCCCYQVLVEKWKDEEDSGRWLGHRFDSHGNVFRLEDHSGSVLVEPDQAELDVENSSVREASSSNPADAGLFAYVATLDARRPVPRSWPNVEMERALHTTMLLARQPVTQEQLFEGMVGPQVARIRQSFEDQGPQADPLREELRVAQIELYRHPFWSPEYQVCARRVTELQERVENEASQTPEPAVMRQASRFPRERYRLTERCVFPGQEYDVTGTCENNSAAGLSDQYKVIRKGGGQSTFLISGQTRENVEQTLKFRSGFMMFGGAVLALFSLAVFFFQFLRL